MLLESRGYQAISYALDGSSNDPMQGGPYDVIILGQSVEDTEKKKLVTALRQRCNTPIISVPAGAGEPKDGADAHSEPDPEELLSLIARFLEIKRLPVAAD